LNDLETAPDHALRQAILRVLSLRTQPGADATAIAAAALGLYDDLDACLAPIIGARSVVTMFRRSIYLASHEFSWLERTSRSDPDDPPPAHLRRSLERQSSAGAADAAVAVLASFGLLLTTFVGTRLTMRLLCEAWPDIVVDNPGKEYST